jgi:hypothetical protein
MADQRTTSTCRLCRNSAQKVDILYGSDGSLRTASRLTCRICGTYGITDMLASTLEKFPKTFTQEDHYRLSALTRSATEQGKFLELSTANASDLLKETPQPSPVEQMDLVLDYIAAHTTAGGKPVPLDPTKDYTIAQAHGAEGLQFVVNSLLEDGLLRRTDKSALPHYRITMAGYKHVEERRKARRTAPATGWPKVDRGIEEIQRRLEEATTEEQFQTVGLLCRETLISLAQAVYEAARHGTTDGKPASSTDAKRMLEAFIAVELGGKTNEEARAHAKAAASLAVALQHDRTADFRGAAVCAEATGFLTRLIAIIAGKRDR